MMAIRPLRLWSAMTTKPKPIATPAAGQADAGVTGPEGVIRLKLAPLGIDHQAADFPVRFIEFCEQNDLYELEVNASGELLIQPMTGAHGSRQEGYSYTFLCNWEIAHFGVAYPQTVRFRLPNGATLGPDAAWMTQERYDALPSEQRDRIIEGAPDFIVEIRSRTDDLRPLQDKMQIWMTGGARLGWLIDTPNRCVYVYRTAQGEPEALEDPETLYGEDLLPGFAFPVRRYVFDLE